jgi:hypothetical protein
METGHSSPFPWRNRSAIPNLIPWYSLANKTLLASLCKYISFSNAISPGFLIESITEQPVHLGWLSQVQKPPWARARSFSPFLPYLQLFMSKWVLRDQIPKFITSDCQISFLMPSLFKSTSDRWIARWDEQREAGKFPVSLGKLHFLPSSPGQEFKQELMIWLILNFS